MTVNSFDEGTLIARLTQLAGLTITIDIDFKKSETALQERSEAKADDAPSLPSDQADDDQATSQDDPLAAERALTVLRNIGTGCRVARLAKRYRSAGSSHHEALKRAAAKVDATIDFARHARSLYRKEAKKRRTRREQRVAVQVIKARGTNQDIADQLQVSTKTAGKIKADVEKLIAPIAESFISELGRR